MRYSRRDCVDPNIPVTHLLRRLPNRALRRQIHNHGFGRDVGERGSDLGGHRVDFGLGPRRQDQQRGRLRGDGEGHGFAEAYGAYAGDEDCWGGIVTIFVAVCVRVSSWQYMLLDKRRTSLALDLFRKRPRDFSRGRCLVIFGM